MSRRPPPRDPRVWLGPDCPGELLVALERMGVLAPSPQQANVFVWTGGPAEIAGLLHPDVAWVQLVSAGVDDWIRAGALDRARTWTNASGAFGAGAIGRATVALLRPFGARCVALTRSGRAVPGADASLAAAALDELLEMSDYVVLATPLTDATTGLIGAREMELLGPNGVLINVARGALIDTVALVRALESGRLGGACLDVTDPEPLPRGHPLWTMPNVVITPHIGNPPTAISGHLRRP